MHAEAAIVAVVDGGGLPVLEQALSTHDTVSTVQLPTLQCLRAIASHSALRRVAVPRLTQDASAVVPSPRVILLFDCTITDPMLLCERGERLVPGIVAAMRQNASDGELQENALRCLLAMATSGTLALPILDTSP